MGQDDRAGSLSDGTELPAQLVEGLLLLCQGDFSYRLPRTRLRDQDDTVAFFFNAIAEELERLVTASRDNEARMTTLVERLGEALVLVASGDFSVQVERDYRGDPADVTLILLSGQVRIERAEGESWLADAVQVIGSLETVAKSDRWYDAACVTEVRALRVDRRRMIDVLEDHTHVARDMVLGLARALDRLLDG